MHLSHIPQCTNQSKNGHISVLNGALWDMGQVNCGSFEIGLISLFSRLTLKHRETHVCVVSTVATDALVLKHQAISILSTD